VDGQDLPVAEGDQLTATPDLAMAGSDLSTNAADLGASTPCLPESAKKIAFHEKSCPAVILLARPLRITG